MSNGTGAFLNAVATITDYITTQSPETDRIERETVSDTDEWVPYQGEYGGEGWQRVSDGEIEYTSEPPGPVPEQYQDEAQAWQDHLESDEDQTSESGASESFDPDEFAERDVESATREVPVDSWESVDGIEAYEQGDYFVAGHDDVGPFAAMGRVVESNPDENEIEVVMQPVGDGDERTERETLDMDFRVFNFRKRADADATEQAGEDDRPPLEDIPAGKRDDARIERTLDEYALECTEIEDYIQDLPDDADEDVDGRYEPFTRLSNESALDLRGTLNEMVAAPTNQSPVSDMWADMRGAKSSCTGREGRRAEARAKFAFGLSGPVYGDDTTVDDYDFNEYDKRAAVLYAAASQAVMERLYGEDYTLDRGVSEYGAATFAKSFFSNPDADEFTVEETAIANYTVSSEVAQSFSHRGLEITETDPTPICANDMLRGYYRSSAAPDESEVWLPGGKQSAEADDISAGQEITFGGREQVGLDEIRADADDGIQSLDERGIDALLPHAKELLARADGGTSGEPDVPLSQSAADGLKQFIERIETVAPEKLSTEGELAGFSPSELDALVRENKQALRIDLTTERGKDWLAMNRPEDAQTPERDPDESDAEIETTDKQDSGPCESCACVDTVDFTLSKSEWVPYRGPEGGSGWQNVETNEVTYDDEPPGETLSLSDAASPTKDVSPDEIDYTDYVAITTETNGEVRSVEGVIASVEESLFQGVADEGETEYKIEFADGDVIYATENELNQSGALMKDPDVNVADWRAADPSDAMSEIGKIPIEDWHMRNTLTVFRNGRVFTPMDVRQEASGVLNRFDADVADDVADHISRIEDDTNRASYNPRTRVFEMCVESKDTVVQHEMSHALADVYGYTQDASTTVFSGFFNPSIGMDPIVLGDTLEENIRRYANKTNNSPSTAINTIDKKLVDGKLQEPVTKDMFLMKRGNYDPEHYSDVPDDYEEPPEEFEQIMDEVNDAWERMFVGDAEVINPAENGYSLTNANETWAQFNQLMQGQGDTADMQRILENHWPLLDTYLDVFDLPDESKESLQEATSFIVADLRQDIQDNGQPTLDNVEAILDALATLEGTEYMPDGAEQQIEDTYQLSELLDERE